MFDCSTPTTRSHASWTHSPPGPLAASKKGAETTAVETLNPGVAALSRVHSSRKPLGNDLLLVPCLPGPACSHGGHSQSQTVPSMREPALDVRATGSCCLTWPRGASWTSCTSASAPPWAGLCPELLWRLPCSASMGLHRGCFRKPMGDRSMRSSPLPRQVGSWPVDLPQTRLPRKQKLPPDI